MATRYLPLALTHSPTPRIEHFALLSGLDAAIRGILISTMPLVVYDALGDAQSTSVMYFAAGIVALIWGLMVPWATRAVPRPAMYAIGCGMYLCGMALAVTGTPLGVTLALLLNAMATVTIFVCFNAYVLDNVGRGDLGRTQSLQMVHAAVPWTVGPMLGVWLRGVWAPAPFVLAGLFAVALLVVFWRMRLGGGKRIVRAGGARINPLAYLGRFARQPRLIAGWSFAVIRSCGWWVYVVYLPYFCIENGLGDRVGGVALSLTNGLLLLSPLMLRLARRGSVRTSVRTTFALCGGLFLMSALLSPWPWGTVIAMAGAAVFLVMLDVVGGLPFLMAVKPSQRTEMSAVYSSFRDVSGIITPGVASLVLVVAPTAAIFAACAAGMGLAWWTAGRLHPRLGAPRHPLRPQDAR